MYWCDSWQTTAKTSKALFDKPLCQCLSPLKTLVDRRRKQTKKKERMHSKHILAIQQSVPFLSHTRVEQTNPNNEIDSQKTKQNKIKNEHINNCHQKHTHGNTRISRLLWILVGISIVSSNWVIVFLLDTSVLLQPATIVADATKKRVHSRTQFCSHSM